MPTRAAVNLAAAMVGVLGLALTMVVVVGAATYDAPPPSLTAEQVRRISHYQHGSLVVVDEKATAEHVEDARMIARRIDRTGGPFGAELRALSLARFDDGGRWSFDVVWVVYFEGMRFPCLGPRGACQGDPAPEPAFILYDAETLAQIGGGTL